MNNKQQPFCNYIYIQKFTKVYILNPLKVNERKNSPYYMNRTTNKLSTRRRHKKIIKLSKGSRGSLSNLFISANQTVLKALKNAYKGRKDKKKYYVKLWTNRVNVMCKDNNTTYTRLKEKMHKKNIELNRKIISKISTIDNEMIKNLIHY